MSNLQDTGLHYLNKRITSLIVLRTYISLKLKLSSKTLRIISPLIDLEVVSKVVVLGNVIVTMVI